ncbi:Amine oxidase [Pyrenophora teres f. maculata]|nr:Amine oxidase [Pyrenophora teres f. maculata]
MVTARSTLVMTTEWNLKSFMAMDSDNLEIMTVSKKILENEIGAVKGQNPGLAARMSQWDKDGKKGKESKGSKKTGAKEE